jgi:hypothetical protein
MEEGAHAVTKQGLGEIFCLMHFILVSQLFRLVETYGRIETRQTDTTLFLSSLSREIADRKKTRRLFTDFFLSCLHTLTYT